MSRRCTLCHVQHDRCIHEAYEYYVFQVVEARQQLDVERELPSLVDGASRCVLDVPHDQAPVLTYVCDKQVSRQASR